MSESEKVSESTVVHWPTFGEGRRHGLNEMRGERMTEGLAVARAADALSAHCACSQRVELSSVAGRGSTTSSGHSSSTMRETRFRSTTWIRLTTPEPRGARTSTFSRLARTNFSPSPSAPSACSASATTLSSLYSTAVSRGCGRPPICFWWI